MTRFIRRFFLTLIMVSITFALLAGTDTVQASNNNTRIAKGVSIGYIDVSSMTADQAKRTLNNLLESMNEKTFTLVGAAGSMEIKGSDMGISMDVDAVVDKAMGIAHYGNLLSRFKETKALQQQTITIELPLTLDEQAVAQAIYDNESKLNKSVVNNQLKKTSSGFTFIAGSAGEEVNVVDSVYHIEDYLLNDYSSSDSGTINLVVEDIEPSGDEEALKSIKDCLGSFSTNFSSSSTGRAQNVKNGVSKINGTIIYPGQEFSVYKAVSPFTEENGYELAGTYWCGQVVETFGGGICQVSTTLYNACIRAELDITERFNHTMLVNYVQPSDDAAISGEWKDLKFKNNYDTPIYIEGYCYNGSVYFKIYGEETRDSGRKVSFESETLSTEEAGVAFTYDSTVALGTVTVQSSAHNGCVARLWKIVTENGVETSRTVFNESTYEKSAKTILVGTQGATDSQISALKAAGNAEDEDKVRSLASQYAAQNRASASSSSSSTSSGDGN